MMSAKVFSAAGVSYAGLSQSTSNDPAHSTMMATATPIRSRSSGDTSPPSSPYAPQLRHLSAEQERRKADAYLREDRHAVHPKEKCQGSSSGRDCVNPTCSSAAFVSGRAVWLFMFWSMASPCVCNPTEGGA